MREPVRFGLPVTRCYADEEQEADAYLGDPLSCDRDGGFADALEDYSHCA